MRYPSTTKILGAAKVSGKTANGLSVGILQSITNNEKARISDGENKRTEVVEPLSNFTLARIQQDFNNGTTILGGIVSSTNRILNPYSHFDYMNNHSFTGGIDFLHQWNDKEFYFDAKLIASSIHGDKLAIANLQQSSARFFQRIDAEHLTFDPNLTSLDGHGGTFKIGKGSKGNWRYSTSLTWRSPGLDLNDMGYMQMADQVVNQNSLSYFTNQTNGIIRSLEIGVRQNNTWDYALNYQQAHFNASFSTQFINKWSISTHACHFPEALDTRKLRGGPAMKVPATTHGTFNISTDESKKASFNFYTYYEKGSNESAEKVTFSPSLSYQPINTLKFSFSTNITTNRNELQYVGKSTTISNQYILGEISQQTFGATFRIDYNITPELSIQYYGSPFTSSGEFSDFKLINNPLGPELKDRYNSIGNEEFSIKEITSVWGVDNPDFTFTQFRSNLVFRWEYLPGSKLYIVWANEKTRYNSESNTNMADAFNGLGDVFPNNVLLVKLSYWFSL
jgi:hypothetical protein